MTFRGKPNRQWLIAALATGAAMLLAQADPASIGASGMLAVPVAGLVCLAIVRRRGETRTL